ncbi:hypothetical protein CJ030_MR7G011811 [Morella rubra]|uniref:Uncharacterized protein n=1 Tax=Morella rubra TaxID=262757 RepID=A0A6A1V2T1_9ROSI|nr:hypothetical protein CJ030_MR7G011811 [Morella rubra]
MPTGGKRLRCDSSVRAESTPGTLAVSSPLPGDRDKTASPVGTQSSCASTSGIIHVRDSTSGIALLKAHLRGKLTVHIPDGHNVHVDVEKGHPNGIVKIVMILIVTQL